MLQAVANRLSQVNPLNKGVPKGLETRVHLIIKRVEMVCRTSLISNHSRGRVVEASLKSYSHLLSAEHIEKQKRQYHCAHRS
jgi:hypothetical protein